MEKLKKIRNTLLVVLCVFAAGYIVVSFYPYLFSRKVSGPIAGVERVMPQMTVVSMSQQTLPAQVFSFSIGIKDLRTGEIVTGSSEDRQWAVAKPGQCAVAEFFPYPPWQLEKWGTYYNVRLLKLSDCDSGVTSGDVATPPPPTEN